MSEDPSSPRSRISGRPTSLPLYSPDGQQRPPALDRQINEAFAIVFAGEAGSLVRRYLEQITLRTVLLPSATDAELRTQEGMRRLYSIIARRIEDGENKLPALPAAKE